MEEIVSLEVAKLLKDQGFSKKTEHYYQDKDLSFSPAGLKRTKYGEKMNHNKYDEFIYSAPTEREYFDWCIGTKVRYTSSIIIHLNKNRGNKV